MKKFTSIGLLGLLLMAAFITDVYAADAAPSGPIVWFINAVLITAFVGGFTYGARMIIVAVEYIIAAAVKGFVEINRNGRR